MWLKHMQPKSIIALGMFSLAIANVVRWFLTHHSQVSENVVDLTQGFLMGIAIATLILGIVAQRRQR